MTKKSNASKWFWETNMFWIIVVILIVGLLAFIAWSRNNVWSKTSGYTVDDCLTICDKAYDIQLAANQCQTICNVFGKPSEKLDAFVNGLKSKVQ